MKTSLEESEKLVRTDNSDINTFHLVKKIVKIGPVDPEIALPHKKNYGRQKYIARSAI